MEGFDRAEASGADGYSGEWGLGGKILIKLINSKVSWTTAATAACVSYVVACLVGAVIYVVIQGIATKAGVGDLPALASLVFQMTLLTALPVFVFLRLLLSIFRRSDLPTFAVAGLLNAVVATVLFFEQEPFRVVQSVTNVLLGFFSGWNLQLLSIGLIVGATYWAVERMVLRKIGRWTLKAYSK